MSNAKSFRTSLAKITDLAAYERLKLQHNLPMVKKARKEIYDFLREAIPMSHCMDPYNFFSTLYAIQSKK